MTAVREKPNILLITTDQQSAHMMSCSGNKYLSTPAMDSLAKEGIRFERAYCSNPVCLPSRISLYSGHYPSECGVGRNEDSPRAQVPEYFVRPGAGRLFAQAGYDAAFAGKIHLPEAMHPEQMGFAYLQKNEREDLARTSAAFIKKKRSGPFCLAVNFVNPHDICYMAIRDHPVTDSSKNIIKYGGRPLEVIDEIASSHGVSDSHYNWRKEFPPLPDNYMPQHDEPESVAGVLDDRPFKRKVRTHWGEKEWRYHRWMYHRLTERVDRQIGVVLDALKASGQWDNTLIVFTSDHGDMDASHQMEHKEVLYEEAVRVPLIICPPRNKEKNSVNSADLISNGLDLLPTLYDYAGIEKPAHLRGKSLRPVWEDEKKLDREALLIENYNGRAVVSDDYKYVLYDDGENREQLFDRRLDPGETKSVAAKAANKAVLERHRDLVKRLRF